MDKSSINIDVYLDANKIPEQINWQASSSSAADPQKAKAMCLAFWDGAEKAALRIDLWTKNMMMDEMGDFYYQMFMTMADTFNRATHNEVLVKEMKAYAQDFIKKFQESLLNQNK